LTIGLLYPFTGSEAAYGPFAVVACLPAETFINEAGGILGHKVTCSQYDTKSDPADAVVETNRMLAEAKNLVFVVGPGPIEAPATVPILERDKMAFNAGSSSVFYSHQANPLFFRTQPADDATGNALAYYTKLIGYPTAGAVFTSDTGAQSVAVPFRTGFVKLAGQIVANETLAGNQTSYRSEAARVLAAHPPVVVGELDGQTASTFLADMQQLGSLPPLIATGYATSQWNAAVEKAVGRPYVATKVTWVEPYQPLASPAYALFRNEFLKFGSQISDVKQYIGDPFSAGYFDGIIQAALAMTEAHSTAPSAYARYILPIANGSPGADVVHTYQQGVKALADGKKIWYVGASGPLPYNRWHGVSGDWEVEHWTGHGGNFQISRIIKAQALGGL
jgi:branched-chain amino acid transport system substrate-binding protein